MRTCSATFIAAARMVAEWLLLPDDATVAAERAAAGSLAQPGE